MLYKSERWGRKMNYWQREKRLREKARKKGESLEDARQSIGYKLGQLSFIVFMLVVIVFAFKGCVSMF